MLLTVSKHGFDSAYNREHFQWYLVLRNSEVRVKKANIESDVKNGSYVNE